MRQMYTDSNIIIKQPDSEILWKQYYQLRYEILRAPWNQGTPDDIDPTDSTSIHAALILDEQILAVGRLHKIDDDHGQIRYMAVSNNQQGKGFGTMVLKYLENQGKLLGLKEIILQARQNAIQFYETNGYSITGDGILLFDIIPHKWMSKQI